MRITRRIMTAPAMAGIATDEIAPGVNISADDELLDGVRNNAETTYHPVGACKMGADPMAVVDDQLRVRGLAGLRVADALDHADADLGNAPSIMIDEKAARMMLASTVEGMVRRTRRRADAPRSGRIKERQRSSGNQAEAR
jgi:choline dehydrogenase